MIALLREKERVCDRVCEYVFVCLCARGKDFNGNTAEEGVCERACEFVCVCVSVCERQSEDVGIYVWMIEEKIERDVQSERD